jgi:hypothetical protein
LEVVVLAGAADPAPIREVKLACQFGLDRDLLDFVRSGLGLVVQNADKVRPHQKLAAFLKSKVVNSLTRRP